MRPCLTEACAALTTERRCAKHEAEYQRERNSNEARAPYNDPKYRKLRKHLLGLKSGCQSCGTTRDLTLDHHVPLAKGGTNAIENLGTVLCRSCNSRKGSRETAVEGPWETR